MGGGEACGVEGGGGWKGLGEHILETNGKLVLNNGNLTLIIYGKVLTESAPCT